MAHIFISYSHKDNEYTHGLARALEQKGFSVWIDDRIDYGSQWPDEIEDHLDDSSALILIMTPRSRHSEWVQNELSRAKAKKKRIFPLLLEGDVWLAVQTTQYVDVRNGQLPPPRFYEMVAEVVPKKVYEIDIGQMVRIPAGEFLYGDEKKEHSLSEYYIDVYPVTNAEYKNFVEAGGYDNKDNWTEKGWSLIQTVGHQKPRFWEDKEYGASNRPDHPVVGISWYEAWAYAKWAGKRLPTELECEKAARGVDGRKYPWGDTFDSSRCNTNESKIGSTTSVTRYEAGKTPYGCYDMAGNVWEWTSTLWRGGEDPNAEGSRVLRGGSWFNTAENARTSNRFRLDPVSRSNYFGFRCAKTP